MTHWNKRLTCSVVLSGLLLGVAPSFSQASGDKPIESFKANVPGEWKTWYGTVWIDEVGAVLDYIASPPVDRPRFRTTAANGGRRKRSAACRSDTS